MLSSLAKTLFKTKNFHQDVFGHNENCLFQEVEKYIIWFLDYKTFWQQLIPFFLDSTDSDITSSSQYSALAYSATIAYHARLSAS